MSQKHVGIKILKLIQSSKLKIKNNISIMYQFLNYFLKVFCYLLRDTSQLHLSKGFSS